MPITLAAVTTDGGRQIDSFTVGINENIDRGDKIGRLVGVTTQNITSIVAVTDYGGRFDIIKEGNDYFLIYKANAVATATLDFEDRAFRAYFEQITFNFYNGTELVDQAAVDVALNNLNEAPTDLSYTTVNTLNENAAQGAVIATGTNVTDPDTLPAYRVFSYALVNQNGTAYTGNNYQIDAASGQITVGPGGLPDVSAQTTVTIYVRVSDGSGGPPHQETVTFTVNPAAANQPPSAPAVQGALGTINENTAGSPTTVVATVLSTDDGVGGTSISYAFAANGNPGGLFSISASTGQITFTGSAQDYETNGNIQTDGNGNKYFRLMVQASDGSLTSTAAEVRIYLNNLPEAPSTPAYTAGPIINENAGANASVGTLTATDPDGTSPSFVFAGTNSTISADGAFKIVNVGGVWQVQVNDPAAIQVTSGSSRTFIYDVRATDGTLQSGNRQISVTVNDVPVNQPPTAPAVQGALGTIDENNATSKVVATVQSTDDGVGGTSVTYLFAANGNPNNLFSIVGSGPNAGQITFTGTAQDFETNSNVVTEGNNKYFRLLVQASDGSLTSGPTEVRIYLNNLNEAPTTPVFTAGPIINENAGANASVGSLAATDPDGTSTSFVFADTNSIISADNAFKIVNVDGVWQVQVNDPTKIQVTSGGSSTFTYNVRATDGTLQSGNRQISITVNDVVAGNDPPEIIGAANPITRTTADTVNIQAFSNVEIQDAGSLVVIIRMDNPAKGSFTGNGGIYDEDAGTFRIEGTAAQVTAALQALRFNARDKTAGSAAEVTNFTITVTDNGGSGLVTTNSNISVSATAPVAQPQNQGPRDITVTGGSIDELSGAGALVATLGATDPDDTSGFVYSIVNPDGRFAISGNQIVVANGVMLDFEQKASHVVRVRVTDKSGAGVSYEEDITITINDRNPETMAAAGASALNDIIKGSKTLNAKDTFFGGAGDDKLWGGYGNDTLWGGTGKDVFVFDGKLGTASTDRKVNYDTIKDYSVKDDSIWIDNDLFKSNKKLYTSIKKGVETKPLKMASKFFTVGDKAKDADDHFVYDAKKRVLYYDADGSGSKAAIELATFTNNKALKGFSVKELFFI